jgi:hypothetical protein
VQPCKFFWRHREKSSSQAQNIRETRTGALRSYLHTPESSSVSSSSRREHLRSPLEEHSSSPISTWKGKLVYEQGAGSRDFIS